jgi:hypothetical protein
MRTTHERTGEDRRGQERRGKPGKGRESRVVYFQLEYSISNSATGIQIIEKL